VKSSYCFHGCPSFVLAQKLKALKADLKMWNDTEFGNVENKRALLDDIKGLDGIEEQRPLSSEEKLRKDVATVELEKTILLEEVSWRQKLRALWLKRGIKIPSSSIGWLTLIENVTR
jgi:hypothetical protein